MQRRDILGLKLLQKLVETVWLWLRKDHFIVFDSNHVHWVYGLLFVHELYQLRISSIRLFTLGLSSTIMKYLFLLIIY